MRRRDVFIAALLTTVGAAGSASAQIDATATPRFEFGIYAGGAATGNWFDTVLMKDGFVLDEFDDQFLDDDFDGDGPGLTPAFGASATWYFARQWGVRAHYGYMASEMIQPFDDLPDVDDGWPINIHAYDLNVVYRPWADTGDGLFADAYVFGGLGALTVDPSGSEEEWGTCSPGLLSIGACLAMDSGFGTVGQGVLGAGFNLIALGPFGVYTEFSLRAYDSPVHDGWPVLSVNPLAAEDVVPVAEDTWAVTGGLTAGISAALGDFDPRPVAVPVPPPPPPPPPPAPPQLRRISICVVQDGGLTMVDAGYNPATRDTVIDGQPFGSRYPSTSPTYAANAPWFASSDAVRYNDADFVKFGVTRVVMPDQLQRAGDINGTSVFVPRNESTPHRVIYVPVRPGCEFQPYQMRQTLQPRA